MEEVLSIPLHYLGLTFSNFFNGDHYLRDREHSDHSRNQLNTGLQGDDSKCKTGIACSEIKPDRTQQNAQNTGHETLDHVISGHAADDGQPETGQ